MEPIRSDVADLIDRFIPPGAQFCVTSGPEHITGPFESFHAAMAYVEQFPLVELQVKILWDPLQAIQAAEQPYCRTCGGAIAYDDGIPEHIDELGVFVEKTHKALVHNG